MPISRPPGSVMCAKPRSIVIPRLFSSARRSGSIPVRAVMSVDLPWSIWPAAADILERRVQHALDWDLLRVAGHSLPHGRLERGQGELVDTKGTRQRMPPHLLDGFDALLAPRQRNPGLRAAQQLVAGESDHV